MSSHGSHHRRDPFPWMQASALLHLFDIYEQAGHELRPVGGCVRDSLLGQEPADIDMAANCPPERGMEILQAAGVKVVPTGMQHGTITAVVNHVPYEITCLRHDVENHGRHATVAWTDDWKADAERRDFTINALYIDRHGGLYDWFGGVDDLDAGRVRFVGDAQTRIEEDYLRILRFYRFSARYARNLDEEGHLACIALRQGLASISVERIWMELRKLLLAKKAGSVMTAMAVDGVLKTALQGWDKPVHGFDHLPKDDLLRFAALIGVDDKARTLARKLKMSNRDKGLFRMWTSEEACQRLTDCLDGKDLRRFAWESSPEAVTGLLYLSGRPATECQTLAVWEKPVMPVQGRDLMEAGHEPGPDMGRVMKLLEAAWLESDFSLTQQQLLSLADQIPPA